MVWIFMIHQLEPSLGAGNFWENFENVWFAQSHDYGTQSLAERLFLDEESIASPWMVFEH